MKKILFVCTGNVFRSMSAEYLMKKYLEDNGIKHILVSSAGTNSYGGYPYKETVDRLNHHGVDPSGHRTRNVNKVILEEADVIICMTKNHQKILMQKFSKQAILFNNIAHNADEDLLDEDEYGEIYGHDFDMKQFIYDTVDHIKNSIPLICGKVR